MGAEHQIALYHWFGGQDWQADCLGIRKCLLRLVHKIAVRLNGNSMSEGAREGPCHFTVPRACIDEDPPRLQSIHDLLQPDLGVPLLIRVIEEGLKGLFIGRALGIKDANTWTFSALHS